MEKLTDLYLIVKQFYLMRMNKVEPKKITIIRDTQEKKNIWRFNKADTCNGTVPESLSTGDYTIKGMEDIFSIERKASTGELAGNITTKQFENELKRGDKLKHFWVVCEFSFQDVVNFPYNSGIPNKIWPKLRVTSNYIIKRIVEMEVEHKVKFIFAGNSENAKLAAKAIFKNMADKYPGEIEV